MFDFVVIGAGAAGEAAAHEARRLGASVAIIERDLVGGSCPVGPSDEAPMKSGAVSGHHHRHLEGGDMDFNSILIGSEDPGRLVDYYTRVLGAPGFSDGGYTDWRIGRGYVTVGPHSEVKGRNLDPGRIIWNIETPDVKGDFERMSDVLDPAQRAFVAERRTATLATISSSGQPRLVPICFVLSIPSEDDTAPLLWSPLDEKPKRSIEPRRLARVRDIAERPEVTLLFERWSEDWSRLAWLCARGLATLVEPQQAVEAHGRAVDALRVKYPQYREHSLETRPMIRVTLLEVVAWSATSAGLAGEAPTQTDRSGVSD